MKILLIYYTGTFNTRYLTEKVKSRFESRGDTVDTVEITSTTPLCECEGYDLIGFSYPIYAFNSPRPFNKYVKKLKFTRGQKYFIYKNSGETMAVNNASSRILIRYMKRRHAELVGEYHFVMPYNIHFKFDRDFVRQIFEKNEKLLDILMYDLENGIVKVIKSKFIYNVASFFNEIQKIGGNVNSFVYKVDTKKCVMCKKCVKECSHENIYVDKKGKIKFHHHCDMCMRCSFFCPTDAINIGFLNGWRVNGDYNFKEIENDTSEIKPYITNESRGFYKCFIKHFDAIDKEHERLFGKSE